MHICIIMSTPFPPEEGIGNYVYNLSKKLIAKGEKVTIMTRGSWNKTQNEIFDGIEIIKPIFLPTYPFHVQTHKIFVNKIFRTYEHSFDIVHIHSPLSPIINTSLPILTTVHTPMMTGARFIEKFNLYSGNIHARYISYPLEMRLLKRSNIITAVSHSVAQDLERDYKLDINEILVVENGVDEDLFFPIKNKIHDNRYVLYTGRLDYRKGLFDFIECGKYICKKYDDVSFFIPGKGTLLNELKEIVKKFGLQEKFKFLGYLDKEELIRTYQNATIYVMPSHYEGLPTVLLEAMSCGLPVVATSVSGNRDVISHENDGILVPSKSPKDISNAISILLDDPKMSRRLGNNARKKIEEKYTWDIISNNFLNLYNLIIDKRK